MVRLGLTAGGNSGGGTRVTAWADGRSLECRSQGGRQEPRIGADDKSHRVGRPGRAAGNVIYSQDIVKLYAI